MPKITQKLFIALSLTILNFGLIDNSFASKEVDPTAYIKALNAKIGPSGWAECINGTVTVTAVSIKYNQTLPADVKKIADVVEDLLGAMRKQMLIDGMSQASLDKLLKSQPQLTSGDQALRVVGSCYKKMENVLTTLQR